MRLPLQLRVDNTSPVSRWKESAPFVFNHRARLIHRPRYVSVHALKNHGEHFAVGYYCNGGANGKTNFSFIPDVPDGIFVCHSCEARAVMAGLPSSSEICGRHIHTGKTIIVQHCCTKESLEVKP